MKPLFSVGIWGEEYVRRFLTYSLASQLADGNLAAVPEIGSGLYHIVTDPEDAHVIRNSAIYSRLREVMPVEIRDRQEFFSRDNPDKYHDLGTIQLAVMREAQSFDVIYFGYADMIWSKGSLSAAARRVAEGYDAVFSPGLPVQENSFCAALASSTEAWREVQGVRILELSSRRLVETMLAHLHTLARLNFASQDRISESPGYVIWGVPSEGVVMRWFHLHPVVMRTRIDGKPLHREFSGSLDEFFVPEVFSCIDRIYLPIDSDEIAFCSIMHDFAAKSYVLPFDVAAMAQWAENYAALVHREFFHTAFEFHHRRTDSTAWAAARAASSRFCDRLFDRLNLPDSVLALMDPDAFRSRRSRQKRFGMWTRQEFSGHVLDEKESGGLWPAPISMWHRPGYARSG